MKAARRLPEFLAQDTVEAARQLLGCTLLFRDPLRGETQCGGRIVETEAYLAGDPASHSFRGRTLRNKAMFMEAGFIYVYLIYGIHHCVNLVTGPKGRGEAVLIRALEPVCGLEKMWERRYSVPLPPKPSTAQMQKLCGGPGNLCRAMGISKENCDGTSLHSGPLEIIFTDRPNSLTIQKGTRIGISPGKGDRELLRFGIKGSRYISRPFPDIPDS